MRILLIMDAGIPIPPPLYGGHERLVAMFAADYKKQGHEVSLLAGPGSHIDGKTYAFGVNDLERSKTQRTKEVLQAWHFLYSHRNSFDLIHNFGRLIYLLPVLNSPVKKIMTYGRQVSAAGIKLISRLPNRNLIFTACSNYCVATGNAAGQWQTVYNAINFENYRLTNHVADDAPLMFLGRLDQIKGVHTAIKVAKATGNKLIIGGNISHTPADRKYFKDEIEPQVDSTNIIYKGALNDEQKNRYLGQAKALLFPIEWDEPFGMVMVEAMACGTPVIAFNRGAVPEVVDEGITGFSVTGVEEMISNVSQLDHIDRTTCRETAKKRFDVAVITTQYLNLFK